jgi:hypothetical protein
MIPPWHEGWPQFLVGCAVLYAVAEVGNRWLALAVALLGLVWLFNDLKKQASADRRSREAASPNGERG